MLWTPRALKRHGPPDRIVAAAADDPNICSEVLWASTSEQSAPTLVPPSGRRPPAPRRSRCRRAARRVGCVANRVLSGTVIAAGRVILVGLWGL
jgi:hypothetical protein